VNQRPPHNAPGEDRVTDIASQVSGIW